MKKHEKRCKKEQVRLRRKQKTKRKYLSKENIFPMRFFHWKSHRSRLNKHIYIYLFTYNLP
jgi:hypothetical protein